MSESYEKRSGRDQFFRLLEQEMELLIDPETGSIRAELAESTACYLCGNDAAEELFRKQGLRFVRCECGLVYMNPRPNALALERLYAFESAANDAWVEVLLSDAEEEFQSGDFAHLLDLIAQHQPSGRLLDVGCSIGRFLHLAQERGYDAEGLELGERAARIARERYGVEVREETLAKAGFADGTFDVISLVEVLEHLPQPREILQELRRILRPGGVAMLGVPNAASLGVLVLASEARTFNRNHLIFFNEETLETLLRQEGFRVLRVDTAVSVLDSVLNHLQLLDPFGPPRTDRLPPRLRDLLAREGGRERLEKAIYDLGMGYRLRVLAQRVD